MVFTIASYLSQNLSVILMESMFNFNKMADAKLNSKNMTPYWRWTLLKIDTLYVEIVKNRPIFCKNVDDAVRPKSDPFRRFY